MLPQSISTLPISDERMSPEAAMATTFWEHVYRYKFALTYAPGRRVLDIACGEGYGSAALAAAGAQSVIGVDINADAVRHAKQRYGIDARVGDALAIPLPDASVDLVVSFETVEHLSDPDRFVSESRRVLVPGGVIVISTPNKGVYLRDTAANPYHLSEMTDAEFDGLMARYFVRTTMFGQCATAVPWWSPKIWRADDILWRTYRGPTRIRRLVQRIFNPALLGGPSSPARANPVETIRARERPFGSWVNPYQVRPLSTEKRYTPTYLIAVAERDKQ